MGLKLVQLLPMWKISQLKSYIIIMIFYVI